MLPHKSDHETTLSGATELERAALAWFARCNRGLAPEEEAEFEAWLAADPQHARIFNEFSGTWELLGRAGAGAAVAPSVVGGRRSGLRLIRTWGSYAAIAAALAVGGYLSWWRPAHYAGSTVTEVGALRILRLPDGSLVTLNTDSAITAAFSPDERRVRLERGEAHFAVAQNPARPFIVQVAGVSVRAVGTAFNVRLGAETVAVLVTEGKVRVEDSRTGRSLLTGSGDRGEKDPAAPSARPEHPIISSGHEAVLARPDLARPATGRPKQPVAAVAPAEIQRQLAWQERRLDFVSAPLAEIVREFNRYNRHKLVIGDPLLADRRFGGSFKPDDREGFVRMLRDNFDISADTSDTQTVLGSNR